jgi:hypothetical protein
MRDVIFVDFKTILTAKITLKYLKIELEFSRT